MADNGAGVSHRFAEIGQHVDFVPQLAQARDTGGGKASLQLQGVGGLAPGAPQQPARAGDALLQRHPLQDIAGK